MLSFERELHTLRPLLGEATTNALIARERREVFPIHPELRIVAWAGAMLLATAAGIVLEDNLERIGPLALALLIGTAAVACYAFVWFRRAKASLVDDYILLLGGLLVSADAAFVENQFHLFGDAWYRHFLILAVVHGAGAYAYRSRTLLSLSLAAMAAWLGVNREIPGDAVDFALRAFEAAAATLMWRFLDQRYNPGTTFLPVFEHFAANLACFGAAALLFEPRTILLGTLLTLVAAGVTVAWGFRARSEPFVLYGFLYAVFAVDYLMLDVVDDRYLSSFLIVVSMIVAIAGLFVIHARFRELRA